jgi:hypothetical protein
MRYEPRPIASQALNGPAATSLPQGSITMMARQMPSMQSAQPGMPMRQGQAPAMGRPTQPMGALSLPPSFRMPQPAQSALTHANPHARFLSTLPGAPQMTAPGMDNPLMGTPTQMRGRVREMALGGQQSDLLQRILAARGMNSGRMYPGA